MKDSYPSYYGKFKCVAAQCPDSCCKDWDVVVDEESEKFYNTVDSALGEKLRRVTVTDEDGDRIFESDHGKCPFWNSDMLCDIYIELGEDRLCKTCKRFPRISLDFGCFCEHMLSFACPEAARLMLGEENAYGDFENAEYNLSSYDGDSELLDFLLRARSKTVQLLQDKSKGIAGRLANCLDFNEQVEKILDTDGFHQNTAAVQDADSSFIFDMLKNMEIMNEEFKQVLETAGATGDKIHIDSSLDEQLERLALYYVYRYYLSAVDMLDVTLTIKRIVCACAAIGKYHAAVKAQGGQANILRAAQQYSKEIEHSYENNEAMDFEFTANPLFSSENLKSILR